MTGKCSEWLCGLTVDTYHAGNKQTDDLHLLSEHLLWVEPPKISDIRKDRIGVDGIKEERH